MTQSIYTVPAGRPFLDCLARAILAGDLPRPRGSRPGGPAPSPLALADITLMLPTRRATRAVQAAFLAAGGGQAMLLPRIVPIAEGDEDASLVAHLAEGSLAGGAPDIPPAMSELERRISLASLILRWSEVERSGGSGTLADFAAVGASTPAQASALAAELARLMDMVETEEASLADLAGLVPETFSDHWQRTLTFLDIVTRAWPAHLTERGLVSPADRRNRLVRAEAERIARSPPKGPVIVAGVTGSIPATVALMRAVARLPQGAIVLPALDGDLDAESFAAIPARGEAPGHPEHPQFGLDKLLAALGVRREDVAVLPGAERDARQAARGRLIAEAMRPAATTGRWQHYAKAASGPEVALALDGVSLVEAATAEDEAEAVALMLRHAAEEPGRTAALVSPDRLLARRVATRLEAWGIKVDDSAGRPLAKTVPGAFVDLVVGTSAEDFAPAAVMALLKHPLCRLGLDARSVRAASRALEVAIFRMTYLGAGLAGIRAALARADGATGRQHPAVRRLRREDWDAAHDLVARLEAAFAPLTALYHGGDAPLAQFAVAHCAVAEAVAMPAAPTAGAAEEKGDVTDTPLWQGEAGDTAHRLFTALADPALPTLAIPPGDYAELYRSLVAGETVRSRAPVHPRLSIWGPFEARLQQPDLVILGSLNDGTWPDAADPGPWLNRPMRRALGLPSPEEKIGQAAHDFATLLGARRVILTRAEKRDGVPTVPSRWLQRLKALLGAVGAGDRLRPADDWLGWAANRHQVTRKRSATRPAPLPALALRPRKLSVSRIEAWIANPYAILARDILGLVRLDPLGQEPSAALRGSIVHEALARFARDFPSNLPDDTARALVVRVREVLDEHAAHPRIAAFWIPRFERFAHWFAETEPQRRAGLERTLAERDGRLVLDAPAGAFTLTARADRIDISPDGLTLTDYKTGAIPPNERVRACLAPQLPLEAAIAAASDEQGGFAEVPKRPVVGLAYIRASGGEPAGEERLVDAPDLAALTASALGGLARLVARFDDPATPYTAARRAKFTYEYDDYAHLARVAEWAAEAAEGEDVAA